MPPDLPTTIFDRSRPRYRLFDLTEEPDGRDMVWFEVGVDNTPGEEVAPDLAGRLFDYVAARTWKANFYAAYRKNRKATLYEPLVLGK